MEVEGGDVFVNTVGTYGIASAAYWWGRLIAIVLRILHYAMALPDGKATPHRLQPRRIAVVTPPRTPP